MTETLSELLAQCRTGDTHAAERLFHRFRHWALNLATAIVDDPLVAEDVLQEAFISALLSLDQLRDPEAFPGWLRQIIRRQAIRFSAKPRETRSAEPVPASTPQTPETIVERDERRAMLHQALAALPPAERETTVRFYIEQQSCRDIARALAIPPGTVKRRLYDARARLRDMLLGYVHEEAPIPPAHTTPGGINQHRLPF